MDALERDETEVGEGEEMDETLSEDEEETEIGATPSEEVISEKNLKETAPMVLAR